MDIVQVLTIIGIAIANIGTTITLFMWATSHAAEDRRNSDMRIDKILEAMHLEMKDFHGKLCALQEQGKSK